MLRYNKVGVIHAIWEIFYLITRVWSLCKTMRDEYVTFHVIPGSCLATLFLQEIWDCMYVHRYVCTSELGVAPKSEELQRAPKSSKKREVLCDSCMKYHCMVLQDLVLQALQEVLQEISRKTCETISRKNFLSQGGARLDSTHSCITPLETCRDQTLLITFEIQFSPNPLFWGHPQYSPPNTPF
jgi:hypothetical protein